MFVNNNLEGEYNENNKQDMRFSFDFDLHFCTLLLCNYVRDHCCRAGCRSNSPKLDLETSGGEAFWLDSRIDTSKLVN